MKENLYEIAAQALLMETGCTVRKWRKSTTGVAFTQDRDWGIEAPRPRGPISFATFAHEIGHQLLHRGNGNYPRWLKEWEAWEFALAQFDRFNLAGKSKAQSDAAKCLVYAAAKANRRGSPATAQAILDTFPSWVWAEDVSCALTGADIQEHAEETA